MNSKQTVLHVFRYNFSDEKTGKLISGCKVTCLPHKKDIEDKVDSRGLKPITFPAAYQLYSDFSALPATYDLDFNIKVVGGKPQVEIVAAALTQQEVSSAA
jgi:hypothetical protein